MLAGKTVLLEDNLVLNRSPEMFRGSLVICNDSELSDLCYILGIVHCIKKSSVFDYDVLVTTEWPENPSKFVICDGKVYCPKCKVKTEIGDSIDECCGARFISDFTNEITKVRVPLISKNSDKKKQKSVEKFQKSMEKDAVRLEYAMKREIYKKEMRQPSLRKKMSSSIKKDQTQERICKGYTKKGIKCTNKALGSSNFCGILSHAESRGPDSGL